MPLTTYVAFLRAVNVGGTGKLPMATLRELCEAQGLSNVRTYLATGNVILQSPLTAVQIRKCIEAGRKQIHEKPIDVFVRTASELKRIVARNPFAGMPQNRTVAVLLNASIDESEIRDAKGIKNERLQLGKREIYIYFPDGMGQSKLRLKSAAKGTARNMNTLAKLVEISSS